MQRVPRVNLDYVAPEQVAARLAGNVSGLRILDYGCGEGVLLQLLEGAGCRTGIDVSARALHAARSRCGADIHLVQVGITGTLPFKADAFDLVVTTEVLEHVPDERVMLSEIARVLSPGGRLVLTTPHQHWLSALDVGNLKFRFPRLHKLYFRKLRGMSAQDFAERYGGESGLIGDISVQSDPWHRHYRLNELSRLTHGLLELKQYYIFGPWARILHPANLALRKILPPLAKICRRIDHRTRRKCTNWGYDICIVATKPRTAAQDATME